MRPEASRVDLHRHLTEATQYRFASICINGVYVADVVKALRNTGVKTCAVIGFPLGASQPTVKAIEATVAVKDGANEIDFVAHLPNLLRRDLASAKADFIEVVKAARSVDRSVIIKVIIESALLLEGVGNDEGEARIESACRAARETGCDFVKTSTGFHRAGGATVEAVHWIKKHSGGLYVKASGGIRTRDDAIKMIEAGADRLGCSASVAIVSSL